MRIREDLRTLAGRRDEDLLQLPMGLSISYQRSSVPSRYCMDESLVRDWVGYKSVTTGDKYG